MNLTTNLNNSLNVFLMVLVLLAIPVGAVNTTPVDSSDIQVSLSATEVEIGDTLVIQGAVSDSIIGVSPGTAIIIISKPMASRVDSYITVQVKDDGSFTYSVPTDATGTWSVSARYGDDTSAVTEVKIVPRTTLIKTTNTLNSYGSPVDMSEAVQMNGFLRDTKGAGVENKRIKYMVALPSYGCSICDPDDEALIWQTYGYAVTDASGRYAISFTPYDHGKFKVKTFFGGDETYQGSASSTRSVQVP